MAQNIHMDEHHVRLQKLTQLKQAGVIPYANKFDKLQSTTDLITLGADSSKLQNIDTLMETGAKQTYSTAGRLMTFRSHGKLSFGTIRDDSGDIQIAFVRGQCRFNTGTQSIDSLEIGGNEVTSYKMIDKFFDVGDFIGVHGDLFITKHRELTLFVNEYQMLSKALRPLGDKWHGIKDEEKQYRQRYLDLTLNEDTYDRFKLRSDFIRYMREFYWDQGFIEVETPTLGNAASGAAAQPFITYHNDFESDFLLRISPETSLKKATVGRFERVFEIGKQFRNEGSDPSHLQEFTSVEHYAAYWNYEDNMKFTEEMFSVLLRKLGVDTTITVKDKLGKTKVVDFAGTRERIDYVAGVNKASGIDIATYGMDDADQLRTDIKAAGHEWVGMNEQGTTTLIDYLYKKVLRPTITGPAFVFNYPKTMQPLARQNDANPNIVEQFQVVVNGWEIIKAYSELVDPLIQIANFDEQSGALESGDQEATSGDDDFVKAMEYGMPCQSGRGMGIDRIITLLTQQDNLRDSILFPLMKSEGSSDGTGGSKTTNIAVAIVNTGVGMEQRQVMNTVAHLNASLGAREGKQLLTQDIIHSQDGIAIDLNIQHAIMIQEASGSQRLREVMIEARNSGHTVTEFTRAMLESSDDKKVIENTAEEDFNDIEFLGVLIYGEKKSVEGITKDFSLYQGNSIAYSQELHTGRNLIGEVDDVEGGMMNIGWNQKDFKLRKAVRIIAIKDGKVRMIHCDKFGYYGLPGGGVEVGETLEDTLHREAHEEGGISLYSFKKLGIVNKYITGKDVKMFEQNYGYVVEVNEEIGTKFDLKEIEEGYSAHRIDIEECKKILNNQITEREDKPSDKNIRNIVYSSTEKIFFDKAIEGIELRDTISDEISLDGNVSADILVDTYLTDTKLHCQQVGFVMKQFAKQLSEDENLRHTAGLLHDIDRDHIGKVAENHLGEQFDSIMDEFGADEHLRRAIKSHYPDGTGIQPESLIEKYLISVDELTGFLYAYARMRPEGYNGIKWKSINKKIKDKQFASGVDREHLKNCETYLGIPLTEFALSVVEACNTPDFPIH